LFEITQKTNSFLLNQGVWQYRDLLMLFVKREVTVYKQTVLGPLVFDTTLVYLITFTIIFNNLAGISTGTVPPFFNLAGITVWNYFTCLTEPQILLVPMRGFFGKCISTNYCTHINCDI
jgi:lipopolysaccharide transport system permease protein